MIHRRDSDRIRAEDLILEALDEDGAISADRLDDLCRAHRGIEAALREAAEDLRSGSEALRLIFREPGGETPARVATEGRAWDELLAELEASPGRSTLLELGAEIARGGMGLIREAWDPTLGRRLAMKTSLSSDEDVDRPSGSVSPRDRRFLEEAQITAQLDHPGIVPVHELGTTPEGQIYFTMKRVRGRTLDEIFDVHRDGAEEWSLPRVVGVLHRVCESLAFAHEKGVIHRDLKPQNIMVGRHGEVYVMDWGVARVLDQADPRDLRLRPEQVESKIQTPRSLEVDENSPLYTIDGEVVGTLWYMSPEQARSDAASVGPRSDVYSVGAMLYELLSGRRPYAHDGHPLVARALLMRMILGPPDPLPRTCAAPELVAICERAMARDPEDRYAAMAELASDLRAFLEQRVVRAYRTGAVAELHQWIRRNRSFATTIAATLFLGLLGVLGFAWQENNTRVALAEFAEEVDAANRSLGDANQDLRTKNAELDDTLEDVRRLSDVAQLRLLHQQDGLLWPAWPEQVPAMKEWIAEAEELLQRRVLYEDAMSGLVPPSSPRQDWEVLARATEKPPRWKEREAALAHIAALDRLRQERGAEASPAELLAWTREQRKLRERIEQIELDGFLELLPAGSRREPEELRSLSWLSHWLDELRARIRRMEARIEEAEQLEQTCLFDGFDAWERALDEVAADPRTASVELAELVCLFPLGPDPVTGLQEFWHPPSGSRPERDEQGGLVLEPDFGMVFVLIPPTTIAIGANRRPDQPNHDALALPNEGPAQLIELPAYFISKYETTQAQWTAMTGRQPSQRPADWAPEWPDSARHPVTNVHWQDCTRTLARFGMSLPTEAQWERAARGGTTTPVWCGQLDEIATRAGLAGNVLDRSAPADWGSGTRAPWSDGEVTHAEVGSFLPNPFGLHDTIGNVREWCLDWYDEDLSAPLSAETGERLPLVGPDDAEFHYRVCRGGCFEAGPEQARVSFRYILSGSDRSYTLGLRPVLPLHP